MLMADVLPTPTEGVNTHEWPDPTSRARTPNNERKEGTEKDAIVGRTLLGSWSFGLMMVVFFVRIIMGGRWLLCGCRPTGTHLQSLSSVSKVIKKGCGYQLILVTNESVASNTKA